MGFPLRSGFANENHSEARSSKQCNDQRIDQTAFLLAPSKPLAVDDSLLLPEREVHAEIGMHWFLDLEIPKKGYVRILAESLLWEERIGKKRIRTTEQWGKQPYYRPAKG